MNVLKLQESLLRGLVYGVREIITSVIKNEDQIFDDKPPKFTDIPEGEDLDIGEDPDKS